ncbi:MAG: hypothetical protein EOO56_17550 [Hymenobacter sp.]|nr:MAG: hypothetical protein EOO56_17550 [Hymenobacter sp.]
MLAQLLAGCPPEVHVTVLGFSQGTAAVSRWLARYAGCWRPQQLVLWAGDFPADIDAAAARQLLHQLPVALVSGDQDEYVSPERLHQQAKTLRQHGATVATQGFIGGHTLNLAVLQQLYAEPSK